MNQEEFESDEQVSFDFELPQQFKVIFFNDDFTTMEFVIEVLIGVFHKSYEEASEIMMTVHNKGKAVAGIYPLDLATTRIRIATKRAREQGFPLQITMEKA